MKNAYDVLPVVTKFVTMVANIITKLTEIVIEFFIGPIQQT